MLIAFPQKEIIIQQHISEIHKAKKNRLGARIFFWLFCKYHSPLVRRALDCIFFFFFFLHLKQQTICTGNFLGKDFLFHSMSKTSLDHLKSANLCRYRKSKTTEHFWNVILHMKDKLLALSCNAVNCLTDSGNYWSNPVRGLIDRPGELLTQTSSSQHPDL